MTGDADRLAQRAFALLAGREFREAAELFAQSLLQRPGDARMWSGLSAALVGVRDYRRAQRAAERAIALDPGIAHAHANLGLSLKYQRRFDEAIAAHAQAVRLAPGAARPVAQLGLALKSAGRLQEAETRLREALALDPQLAMARRNLAVVLAKLDRSDEAAGVLRDLAAREGGSEPATAALLQRLLEDLRMRDAVADALRSGSPQPIVRAAGATPSGRIAVDGDRLAQLGRLAVTEPGAAAGAAANGATSAAADAAADATTSAAEPAAANATTRTAAGAATAVAAPRGAAAPLPGWWPRVEAHFNLHLGDDAAAVLRSIAARDLREPGVADLAAATQAVAARIALPAADPPDHLQCEARIRWYHALIARNHPDWLPGRFKLLDTLVTHNPADAHTPPDAVAGTLRAAFGELIPRMAPGLARAALAMVAIGRIHPFSEANGRIARLLASGECEAAGLGPLVVPGALRGELQAALVAVAGGAPLAGVVEVLGRALAFTRALIERIGADAAAAGEPTAGEPTAGDEAAG